MARSGSMVSYRDRTSEFHSLTERLKRIQYPPTNKTENDVSEFDKNDVQAPTSASSDFSKMASKISAGIHDSSQKISRLSKMTKKTSIFDDPTREIEELTAIVKEDITKLNAAISEMQVLRNYQMGDGKFSKDGAIHYTTVIDDLNSRLQALTKDLKDVLITRSENLKAHENRKQMFSSNARVRPFPQQRPNAFGSSATNTNLPPWTNGSAFPSSNSIVRRRVGTDNSTSIEMGGLMAQQQLTQQRETPVQSTATGLQNIESTISELCNMFTQIAPMVAQQGELAIRIDDNMDDSLSNVARAQDSLLKHLRQISSNRWLIIKIFVALIVFMLIFIIFVA